MNQMEESLKQQSGMGFTDKDLDDVRRFNLDCIHMGLCSVCMYVCTVCTECMYACISILSNFIIYMCVCINLSYNNMYVCI